MDLDAAYDKILSMAEKNVIGKEDVDDVWCQHCGATGASAIYKTNHYITVVCRCGRTLETHQYKMR